MLYCPSCGASHREGFTECATCRVPLTEAPEPQTAAVPPGEWVSVFRGTGIGVRTVQENLEQAGFRVVRLPGENVEVFPIEASRGTELSLYALAVPEAEYAARKDEVEALTGMGQSEDEAAAAVQEAEEDYDVRGCPACLLYLHHIYSHCPGCGAALVPAVDCFMEGESAPDRVIVGDGPEAEVKALEGRLRAQRFDAQAFAVEDWPVNAVDLPWIELTDRTAEAEEVLGLR